MELLKTMQAKERDFWKLIDYNIQLHDVEEVEVEVENSITSLTSAFKFPPPPRLPVLPAPRYKYDNLRQSVSDDTETNSDSQSDQATNSRRCSSPIPIPPKNKNKSSGNLTTSSSSGSTHHRSNSRRGYQSDGSPVRNLPPIGVFWDIENCQIPRGKSAISVAQAIREKFFAGYREAEFVVVCDVKKEIPIIVKELNEAQINLIHVDATCKNAADEKLRQSMRRFADTHGSSACIVLISGDVNFVPDLCDLRHRKKIHLILLHLDNCSTNLIMCANEHYSYSDLTEKLPLRPTNSKLINQSFELVVASLPVNFEPLKVRARLKRLAENCGGRVGHIIGSTTTVKFPTLEFALRAKKRMEGEKVFGSAITLGYPRAVPVDTPSTALANVHNTTSPLKPRFNIQRRKMDETNMIFGQIPQVPSGIAPTTTTILQYMGPVTHQAMASQWPTQQHIHHPPLSIYGNGGQFLSYPHLMQSPHLSAIPTVIHTQSASSISSQQQNVLDVFSFGGNNAPALTAPTTAAFISSTSGLNSGHSFNHQSNIWNYNPLPNPIGTASFTAASNANVHQLLTGITSRNTTATQDQSARGRPILGAHNVTVNEPQQQQPLRLLSRQQESKNPHLILNSIDKKQLQTEGVMQWLNKSSNGTSNSDSHSENCEKIEGDRVSSDVDGDRINSVVTLMGNIQRGGLFNKVNMPKQQNRNESSSSPLLGTSVSSTTILKPDRQKSTNGSLNATDLSGAPAGTIGSIWQQSKGNRVLGRRKCRTPSPYMLSSMKLPTPPTITTQHQSHCHSDSEKGFNPISSSSSAATGSTSLTSGPVELLVSNLDQNIDAIEMKKILMDLFQEHVMVLHISMFVQSGSSLSAIVKVRTLQDAQYAISQLHRKKIGFKRITISHARSTSPHNPQVVRSQVVAILSEVPGHQLPLFKFRELFESRYLKPISASDLNRLRDVCDITEGVDRRTISLNKEYYKSCSSPQFVSNNQDNDTVAPPVQSQHQQPVGFLVCTIHASIFQSSNGKGWAEQKTPGLPCVKVPLAEFSSRIHALINSHNNMLPLTSLCDCYEAEFGALMQDENGVPLEHLVTCVSGVELQVGDSLAKYLRTAPKNSQTNDDKSDDGFKNGTVSPSLAHNLHMFSKDLIDLLKSQPHCVLSVNKFIPAYHHHFRRQCRVADYGFTRLVDVFEAMPNIVQLMGEGNRRMLTLTHKSQMRRFSIDLSRVLKMHSSKKVNLNELPGMFERHLGKAFDPVDYGLCYLADLLSVLTENTVVITSDGDNSFIAIPKREQTVKEMERTKIFAQEVVGLLAHCPQYSLLFERFIPAYHHHYGRQCRVSDFGFTKLIELFEAIPHIVKIEDVDGERHVTLTNEEKLKVFGEQVLDLVNGSYPPGLLLSALPAVFLWQYGYALKPSTFDCNTLLQLVSSLNSTVKLVDLETGVTIVPLEQTLQQNLFLCVWRILMKTSAGKMEWNEFEETYRKIYKQNCDLETIKKDLINMVKIRQDKNGEAVIQLTDLQLFARDVYRLLYSSDGKLPFNTFESAYLRYFDTAIQPSRYGYSSITSLLQAVNHIVVLRGKGAKRLLLLNKNLASAGIRLPSDFIKNISNVAASNCTGVVENTDLNNDSCNVSTTSFAEWPFPKSPSPYEALLNSVLYPSENDSPSSAIPNENEESSVFKTPVSKRSGWSPKVNSNEHKNIVINLPKFDTPPPFSPSLISPCKYLLPSISLSDCHAPHPSQLPKVFLFENNENGSDEHESSGNLACKPGMPPTDTRDSESSFSGSENGTPKNSSVKRKLRLAAQFHTPMELKY